MEKLPSDRQLSFLSDFFYGVTYPLNALLDLLVRHFLLVGHRNDAFFQIYHTGDAGNVIGRFRYTIGRFFSVHPIQCEYLDCNHSLQLLFSGLVIAGAAAAALASGSPDQGDNSPKQDRKKDAQDDGVLHASLSFLVSLV